MANLSLIILSHNKPGFVKEAVQSVLDQNFQDWEAVLVDSGVLLNQCHFDYLADRRIEVMPSGETTEQATAWNMASWCFNNVIASGRLSGELIMYLCDDDLLYPDAFDTYWNYYIEHNREPQAMYASQDLGVVGEDGITRIVGQRRADRPAGRFCKGRKLDFQVDYLQFCHTRAILDKLCAVRKSKRPHCEDKREADHADGIFMEQIGALTTVHPIDKVLSMNRRTAASVNLSSSGNFAQRFSVFMKYKMRGLRRKFSKPLYL